MASKYNASMIRAVIVGARCRRQGIGQYIARGLKVARIDIAGIVGTSENTVREAQQTLRERYAILTNGYTSLATALENERPDLVAICSPYTVHREQLEMVARASLHCLSEKPLWWTEDADNVRAATETIADSFTSQGRLLDLVTQWPFTLGAFDALHPGVRSQPFQQFEMILSPYCSGETMIPDAVPHVSSMLYALTGEGEVHDITLRYLNDSCREMSLRFRYRHANGNVGVNCRFVATPSKPRPASYAINGHWIHRTISFPDYDIGFSCDDRSIRVEDPLDLMIRDFLHRMTSAESTNKKKLVTNMLAVQVIAASARHSVPAPKDN
jgi:hypothetical protein